ncbi:MAG: peptidoglycan binding domain-containing protein [Propionibacteriales bacterium]|nr:peptidoglycan binding domain-containing protein [Propionibacteriales bacterium]
MRLWPRRKLYIDSLPKTHDIRFAVIFLLGFGVLVAGVYAVGHAIAGDRLPSGTTVAGVDVGGMRAGRARTVLQTELVPRLETPVMARVAGQTFRLDPQESGLTLDIDATIDEALGGGEWDPRHMLHVVTGGGPVDPVVVVDAGEMRAALHAIEKRVRREPVDAEVTFPGGQVQVRYAEPGRTLDKVTASERLRTALLSQDREVSFPLTVVEPEVSSTAATRFVTKKAGPAVSAPVRLRVLGQTLTVPPRVFGPALEVSAGDRDLHLRIDAEALMARSQRFMERLPRRPVDARIEIRGGLPIVVPGRAGITVTPKDWGAAVLRAATRDGSGRDARPEISSAMAQFTTQQARLLRVQQRLAAHATRYTDEAVGDVTVPARALDGTLLFPGDSFNFAKRVDIGGSPKAASLVAATVYDVAFRSGLTIVERTSSPFYDGQFSPGVDASVGSEAALVVRNDSPFGVYIHAYVDSVQHGAGLVHVELFSSRYVRVSIKSSPRYDVVAPQVLLDTSPQCRPRQGVPGFKIDVRRTMRRAAGDPGRRELTHTQYSPLDAVVCR